MEVDFDALWDHAFQPALEELGYLAIRADIEAGTVILKDMLERLAFANLVIADLTLPNGNVYYEVGIRHVAKQAGCVLIAADWSRQLFDVDQMRTLRYPLQDGAVPEETARVIKDILVTQLPKIKNSSSPYHELVKDKEGSSVFREQIETISAFQAEVQAARMEADTEMRQMKVRELMSRYQGSSLELQ
jgi:2',3'-cyclic-nucleotide 2'-phosphodiesterase (5'-nucleotidase family)